MNHNDKNVLSWKHLKNERLYSDNDYAVEALKKGIDLDADGLDVKVQIGSKNVYHCFWCGDIERKQVFSIKSFLCTQNLEECRIILWLDVYSGFENYEENPFLKPVLPFIEVKSYDPVIEVKGTPWEDFLYIPNEKRDLVRRGDAFRFLMLYKYGGTYFDLDIMFLKDLGGLLNAEFCYAWEIQPYANSAILNLKPGSDICAYLMEKTKKVGAASPWGIFLYSDSNLKDLYVLPCAFFDPIWQGLEPDKYPFNKFPEFFAPFDDEFRNKLNIRSYKEFFPGCYAYHWHNRWKSAEYEESFFGIFDKEFNELLKIN